MFRILMAITSIYSLFFNTTFASNYKFSKSRFDSKFLIKSYVKEYSDRIEKDIDTYNKVRKDRAQFINLFPKKDQKPFLNLLKQYRVNELPEIKKEAGKYQVKAENHKLEFDLVSLYENQVYINGQVFKFKTNDIRDIDRLKKLFTFKQRNSYFPKVMEDAHAGMVIGLIVFGAIAAGAAYAAYLSQKHANKRARAEQAKSLNEEIKQLINQCEEDLPHAGKPTEAKETLALLSLFTENNKIQEDALENHLYKSLVGKNKELKGVKKEDPVNCKEFAKLVESTSTRFEKAEKAASGLDTETEVCSNHKLLKDCLTKFDEQFRTNDQSRSIESYIKDYVPENQFIRKSLKK